MNPTFGFSGFNNVNPSVASGLGLSLATPKQQVQATNLNSSQTAVQAGMPINSAVASKLGTQAVATSQVKASAVNAPAVAPAFTFDQIAAQAALGPNQQSVAKFSVPAQNTFDSSVLNGGMSRGALLDMQQQKAALMNTQQGMNLVPSDNYMSQIYQGLLNNSQYTDQEKQLIQSNNDLTAKIYNTQLAERRQIQALQENGQITKEQAAGFISESQRRADQQNADQAGLAMFNTAQLKALADIRGNQLTAFQNAGQFLNQATQQVAPGSTLYNPALGGTVFQGNGASPSQIAQQASTFIAQDQATGNLQLNADGTINQQYYQQAARQYFNGGAQAGGAQLGMGGGLMSQPTNGLPPNIANQPYVIPGTANTPSYINLGRVPKGQEQYVAQVAGAAGMPVLDANDSENVQGIQKTLQAIQPLEEVMNKTLSSGVFGRGVNIAKNAINNIFQNQPELVAFNQARTTAINVIQGLAAGAGSGFRLTQPEIDTATSNMPVATDNLETAQAKLTYVKSYLQNQLMIKITGNANNLANPGQTSNNSGNIWSW